jgi:flagellar hook-basal body complex protein FliE
MAAPITPISGAGISFPVAPASAATESGSGGAFQKVLAGAIQDVEAFGRDASASVSRFLSGEGEELHSTILATQRAELSFELFQQVRNKVVSAYQEIMRMQM